MRSRCAPQERLKKLAETGGSPECERVVSNSLEWLKQKQNPDIPLNKSKGNRESTAIKKIVAPPPRTSILRKSVVSSPNLLDLVDE